MEDNITKEKEEYKAIGPRGLNYKLFEEEESGNVRKGIYGYLYLKHITEFWPGYWEEYLLKIKEVVFENN